MNPTEETIVDEKERAAREELIRWLHEDALSDADI